MPREHHPHRFPFPPARDPFEAFPTSVPWDTPIAEISSRWLELRCAACDKATMYPLRLMAAERGWELTLRTIVPRLRCQGCGAKPTTLQLVEDGGGEHGRGRTIGRLDLLR